MHEEDICSLPKHSPALRVKKAPHIEIEVLNNASVFSSKRVTGHFRASHWNFTFAKAEREPPTFSKPKDDAPCILIK
jgi:hypothetical protein